MVRFMPKLGFSIYAAVLVLSLVAVVEVESSPNPSVAHEQQQQQGQQQQRQQQRLLTGQELPDAPAARKLLQMPTSDIADTNSVTSDPVLLPEDVLPEAEGAAAVADQVATTAVAHQAGPESAADPGAESAAEPAAELATDPAALGADGLPSAHPPIDIDLEAFDPEFEVSITGLALHQGSAAAVTVDQPSATPSPSGFQRCGTPKVPEAAKAAADAEVEAYYKNRPSDVIVAAPSGPISVHWHILVSNGRGGLTDQQINAQMVVMNAAYARAGIYFVVASRTRYGVSSRQFTATMLSTPELSFRRVYRRGTARDLNIFTWAPLDGALGWSTFPFEYAANPKVDGVVINWTTLPGVCQANPGVCTTGVLAYSLGDTTVHEVRAAAAAAGA
jgi:hypothetical protein